MPSDDDKCCRYNCCRGGCCGGDDDDGCCADDCCDKQCCNGRVSCSLEAGFAGPFASLSFALSVYASYTCDFVEVRGHKSGDTKDDDYVVAFLRRGVMFGQVLPYGLCLSWTSLDKATDDLVHMDALWMSAIAFAIAADAVGFAALVQILSLSCAPRRSQRYLARCASVVSMLTAVFQGLTLLFLGSPGVKYHEFEEDVDYTSLTLHKGSYCVFAAVGGWLITALILCFVKKLGEGGEDDGRPLRARGGEGSAPEDANGVEAAADGKMEDPEKAPPNEDVASGEMDVIKETAPPETEVWEDAASQHDAREDSESPFSSESESDAETPESAEVLDDFIDG